jgi:hypothetical protein
MNPKAPKTAFNITAEKKRQTRMKKANPVVTPKTSGGLMIVVRITFLLILNLTFVN